MAIRSIVQIGKAQIGSKPKNNNTAPGVTQRKFAVEPEKHAEHDNIHFSARHRVAPWRVSLTGKHHLTYGGLMIKMG